MGGFQLEKQTLWVFTRSREAALNQANLVVKDVDMIIVGHLVAVEIQICPKDLDNFPEVVGEKARTGLGFQEEILVRGGNQARIAGIGSSFKVFKNRKS